MNLTIMNLIQYLKKIIHNCFIKNKDNEDYSNIILFTPEYFDSELTELTELE